MFAKKTFFTLFFCVGLSYYWMNYVKRGPVYESEKRLLGKTVLITGKVFGLFYIFTTDMIRLGKFIIVTDNIVII